MAKMLDWLKATSAKLLDPNREVLLADWTERLERQLFQQGKSFSLPQAVAALAIRAEDVPLVVERIYERSVQRAWKDHAVTEKEHGALELIARLLQLPPERARDVGLRAGLPVFEAALGHALADGVVDAHEATRLSEIAASLRMTMRELVLGYFRAQGEALLRSMFAAIAEDGQITDEEWDKLIVATRALGLSEADLRKAIEPQAERFVEHVLADAKADERLSDSERRTLGWLLSKLSLSRPVAEYVQREIQILELFTAIGEGRLPSVTGANVSLRSGEICHFCTSATYYQPRNRQNGPRYDQHHGTLAITDYRMLFDSPLKTLEVNHRKVVSLIRLQHGLELHSSGKGTGVYSFGQQDKLAIAIYQTAVAKANQTIVAKSDGLPTRHIPRDVRQRVWQRYGGRCAECSATQYLEFDHIVPVAKGGSNSDVNVQLLCRACNAKKADLI